MYLFLTGIAALSCDYITNIRSSHFNTFKMESLDRNIIYNNYNIYTKNILLLSLSQRRPSQSENILFRGLELIPK